MHSKVHKMEQRNDRKTANKKASIAIDRAITNYRKKSINNPFTIMVYLTIEERGNPTLIV